MVSEDGFELSSSCRDSVGDPCVESSLKSTVVAGVCGRGLLLRSMVLGGERGLKGVAGCCGSAGECGGEWLSKDPAFRGSKEIRGVLEGDCEGVGGRSFLGLTCGLLVRDRVEGEFVLESSSNRLFS